MGWSLDPFADASALAQGIAGVVTGNQAKQKNKGTISQAYRQNVAQTNLAQANTRESLNESLNARGVLSPGAGRPNATSITQAVAASGGKGGGGGITGYLPQAGVGAVGAANTLAGGENAQMTDQFALADKANQQAEAQALNQNNASYVNTIIGAVTGGVQTDANIRSAQDANAAATALQQSTPGAVPTATGPAMSGGPIQGQYGPVNPSWTSSSTGTRNASGSTANYSFNAV